MQRTHALLVKKAQEMGIDLAQGRGDQLFSIEIDLPADGQKWADWRFDRTILTLTGYGYEVDLEQMTTSAGMLDWIFQVAKKGWCTPDCLYGLIEALQELLDPQATLCSGGGEHGPIHPKSEIEKRSQP